MVPVLVHARKRTFSITKTTISNTICWLFINDEYEQVTFVMEMSIETIFIFSGHLHLLWLWEMGAEEKRGFYIRVPVSGGSRLELRWSVTLDRTMGPWYRSSDNGLDHGSMGPWTVGPVSELLVELFHQTKQLSDFSLNCLAFPPVSTGQPYTAPPLSLVIPSTVRAVTLAHHSFSYHLLQPPQW